MDLPSVVSGLAGILTTIAFLPQVIKTYQSKSAKNLSLSMFSIFCTVVLLWLVYGILKQDWAIVATNTFTLILSGILLYFKFTFKE